MYLTWRPELSYTINWPGIILLWVDLSCTPYMVPDQPTARSCTYTIRVAPHLLNRIPWRYLLYGTDPGYCYTKQCTGLAQTSRFTYCCVSYFGWLMFQSIQLLKLQNDQDPHHSVAWGKTPLRILISAKKQCRKKQSPALFIRRVPVK